MLELAGMIHFEDGLERSPGLYSVRWQMDNRSLCHRQLFCSKLCEAKVRELYLPIVTLTALEIGRLGYTG